MSDVGLQQKPFFIKKYIDTFKRSPKTQELIAALQTNENTDVQNLHFTELIISKRISRQTNRVKND